MQELIGFREQLVLRAIEDLEELRRSPDCAHPERIDLDIRRLRRRRPYLAHLDRRDA